MGPCRSTSASNASFVSPREVTFEKLAVPEAGERPFAIQTVDLPQYDALVCICHQSTTPVHLAYQPNYCTRDPKQSTIL